MDIIRWGLSAILSILAGYLVVKYLTAKPLAMTRYAVLAVLTAAALAVTITALFSGWHILLAAALALAGFLAGWLVTNHRFLTQEEHRALPVLNPPPPDQRSHTALIYFTHGEPPGYDPMPWVETFKEFDAVKAPFIPVPFRPFFFQQFRARYLRIGGSPHNILHGEMRNSLEALFRAEGDHTTRFYTAFLDSNPRPDEAVIRAVNDGARRIIIANVFLTISSHTEAGQKYIDSLQLQKRFGIPVIYTAPLWDSPELIHMFVDRADRCLGDLDRSQVGVLLVGHGQPAEWDAIWPTQTSQEQHFREEVLNRLEQMGFPRHNLAQAWMEFKPPKPQQVAPQLATGGLRRLLVFSAAISASSLHSLYDVPHQVQMANLPAGVAVVNLGAWDNHPLVIRAIREKIRLVE